MTYEPQNPQQGWAPGPEYPPGQQFAPSPGYPRAAAPKSNGLAIAALVIGIIAVILSPFPIINAVSFVLGPIAAILGLIALLTKVPKKGMGIAGIILGIASVIVAIVMIVFVTAWLSSLVEEFPNLPQNTAQLVLDEDWTIDRAEFTTTVQGTVTNTSDKDYSGFVTISFDVINTSGATIGTCTDVTTSTIPAKGQWEFMAVCMGGYEDGFTIEFREIFGI